MTVAGRRFYPIQVAEKGYAPTGSSSRGTWGHGSMPRETTRSCSRRRVVERLAVPGPIRLTPVMARFLETAAAALRRARGGRSSAAWRGRPARGGDPRALCDPMYARALRALLRDTISPDVIHAGVKYNVIPGEAVIEVDCRALPGTTEPAMRAELDRADRAGPGAVCRLELIVWGEPVEAPAEGPLWEILVATLRDHDPEASRCRPWHHSRRTRSPPSRSGPRRTASRRSPRPRRALPRALPRRRRAGLRRRPAVGPPGPLRRRPPLLRLIGRPSALASRRHSPGDATRICSSHDGQTYTSPSAQLSSRIVRRPGRGGRDSGRAPPTIRRCADVGGGTASAHSRHPGPRQVPPACEPTPASTRAASG